MQEESHFLIIGLGLLGGSYAQGLKRKGYHVSECYSFFFWLCTLLMP